MNDSKVISIRLQGWIAESIDEQAAKYGMNRSKFITGIYLGWLDFQTDKNKYFYSSEGWEPSERETNNGKQSD